MITRVLQIIERTRVDLSTEKSAQADLESAFMASGLPFLREERLAPGDIVDFLIAPDSEAIGIEVKLQRSGKVAAFRQLTRYARHGRVKALVLASNMSMGLPKDIGGKPVYLASLGRAWL